MQRPRGSVGRAFWGEDSKCKAPEQGKGEEHSSNRKQIDLVLPPQPSVGGGLSPTQRGPKRGSVRMLGARAGAGGADDGLKGKPASGRPPQTPWRARRQPQCRVTGDRAAPCAAARAEAPGSHGHGQWAGGFPASQGQGTPGLGPGWTTPRPEGLQPWGNWCQGPYLHSRPTVSPST